MKAKSHVESEHLPAFKSWEECEAHTKATGDDFYLIAFLIEAWMGDVSHATFQCFSKNKSGRRILQTGVAWESWRRIFGKARPDEWPDILTALSRYSRCDAPESEHIAHMLALVALEDQHGEPVSPSARLAFKQDPAPAFDEACRKMRYLFQRMSEWLEAITHWKTHLSVAIAPKLLQDSPEKRELYQLGLIQRNYANLDAAGKAWWHFRHGDTATQYAAKPELGLIGQAQSNEKWGALKRPQVDELAIHWWPLLKRHHWTDRDMRLLIQKVVDQPEQYPLVEDKEFADYRQKVLGLKKSNAIRDKSAPDGRPVGWKVAMAMVKSFSE